MCYAQQTEDGACANAASTRTTGGCTMRRYATKPNQEALSADERQRKLSKVYRLLFDLARENENKDAKPLTREQVQSAA
jgi:hypothetical protein